MFPGIGLLTQLAYLPESGMQQKKGSRRLEAAAVIVARNILLDIQLESRLRTLHSNASDLHIWSHAWIYRKRRQIS